MNERFSDAELFDKTCILVDILGRNSEKIYTDRIITENGKLYSSGPYLIGKKCVNL